MGLASTLTSLGLFTDDDNVCGVRADVCGVRADVCGAIAVVAGGKGDASHVGVAGVPALSLVMLTTFSPRGHHLSHRG